MALSQRVGFLEIKLHLQNSFRVDYALLNVPRIRCNILSTELHILNV